MATLRELIGVNTDTGRAAQIQDENIASGMGSIARGWTSGRIATDANAMRTDEMGLRAAGDVDGADTLRGQIGQLQQRQQLYAPQVGRVEDIDGVGSALGWLGSQVGQGAASMLDPIAAGAAVGGAAKLAGMLPGGIGRAGKLLGGLATFAAPYAINQRQLTGEFGNDAARDPELMARTTPGELRNMANLYGAGAGALDTLLPHVIGKQLVGGGLRQGLRSAGPLAATGGGMLLEGGTEYLQGKGSQFAQGLLNPERDTSGDASLDLNNFAGGMAGGMAPAALGAYADAGYRRAGDTAERLGEGVHDLAQAGGDLLGQARDAAAPLVEGAEKKSGAWWKRGREAAEDLQAAAAGEDGKITVGSATAAAKNALPKQAFSPEEMRILTTNPPAEISNSGDDIQIMDWLDNNDAARAQLVADRLGAMVDDPQASQFYDGIMAAGADRDAMMRTLDPATKYLLDQAEKNQLNSKINRAAEVAASALGRGAVAAGRAAVKFGSAVADGARQGMSEKKNMQTVDPQDALDAIASGREAVAESDTFQSWRDRYYGVRGQDTADAAIDARGKELSAQRVAAQEMSYRRASMFGEMLAAAAQDMPRAPGFDRSNGAAFMRDIGYEIADMAEGWGRHAEGKAVRGDQAKRQAPGAVLALDAMANDLRVFYGSRAGEILQELEGMADPSSAPMFAHLNDALARSGTQEGRKSMEERRAHAANTLLLMLPTARANEVVRSGRNGKTELLESMEEFSKGRADPGLRKALEEAAGGRENLNRMLEVVSGIAAPETKVGEVVDDRGAEVVEEAEEPSTDDERGEGITRFQKNAAEKNLAKGVEPKLYAFHGELVLRREGDEASGPFGELDEPDADGVARRPKLFKPGQQLFGGKGDAISKKIADVKAQLMEDPDYPDHDNYQLEAKSAYDVLKEMGVQDGKILQLFRDYAHAGYHDANLSPEEKRAAARLSGLASKTIVDALEMQGGNKLARGQQYRTTPDERREVRAAAEKFFKGRFVVVGEKLSESVPEKITFHELRKMGESGRKALDWARKSSLVDGKLDGVKHDELVSEANVIMFEGKNGKPLAIPAGKLVMWAKQQQGKMEQEGKEESLSDKNKNAAYRKSVMTAISVLMDSGLVNKEWPYKLNAGGEQESFAEGIPPSLHLATSLQGKEDSSTAKWRAMRQSRHGQADLQKFQGPNQEKVSIDQERGEEVFVADPLQAEEPGANGERAVPERGDLTTGDLGRPALSRAGLEVNRSGRRNPAPKSDSDGATEMDFFPKRKDDEVPGDFDDQQYLTRQTMAGFELPKSKLAAMRSAKFSAEKITALLMDDPRMARDVIMSHLRMALNEGRRDPNGLVDDAYRIAPIIDLISPGNVALFVKRGATPRLVDGMKRAALTVLIRAAKGENEISDSHLSMLAKQLGVPDNLKEMQALLAERGVVDMTKLNAYVSPKNPSPTGRPETRIADAVKPDSTEMKAKVEPAPEAAKPKPTVSDLAEDRIDYLRNPPDDYTPARAQEYIDWAKKQLARIEPAIKAAREPELGTETDESMRLMDLRSDLRQVVREGESILRYDRELEEKMGPQGEVAAGLGKPRGGAERKLNAMANEIHTSLGRSGFAATHDSPIRHEGKFDWRAHIGKGEGNASFGAGTYLSTSDGVHKSYKDQFTARSDDGGDPQLAERHRQLMAAANAAMSEFGKRSPEYTEAERVRAVAELAHLESVKQTVTISPTYEVSADIPAEQLLDWDAPLSKQSPRVQDALRAAGPIKSEPWSSDWNFHGAEVSDGTSVNIEDDDGTFSVTYKGKEIGWADTLHEAKDMAEGHLKKLGLTLVADVTGQGAYEHFVKKLGSQAAASEHLQSLGILGHKYAASGGRNDTHPNYVIYDDSKITTNYVHFNAQAPEGQAGEDGLSLATMKPGDMVNLYRGENAANVQGGEWWTSDPLKAERYGDVTKVTLPAELVAKHAVQGHNGKDEFVFPTQGKRPPDLAKGLKNSNPSRATTDAEMAAARAYAAKTLGPKIKVMFREITGYSGEFISATNTIEIATTAAAGTMGTLYHEAMHVFFRDFVKSNPKLQAMFEDLVNDDKHLARLHALLDGYPAAQAQLVSGEERLAYTFQFWKAGLLQVDAKAHTWMQKVGKFFRRVLGQVRASEHALALFEAFDQGKMSEPSAAGRVIARELGQGSLGIKARRQLDGLIQGLAAAGMPAGAVLGTSASPTARTLGKMLFTNPGEEAHGREATGMLNARRNVSRRYTSASNQIFAEMSDVDQRVVQKHLQAETPLDQIADADQRRDVQAVRELLARFHTYMLDAGMKIGKVENYYPTVWSLEALQGRKDEFIKMLVAKYPEEISQRGTAPIKAATRIWQSLVEKDGVDAHLPAQREDGVLNPFFASQEMRTLPWLKGEDKERFLEKNMPMTLTRYFSQGAHATEYFRRFGKDGHKLEKALKRISDELRTVSQEMVRRGELEGEDGRVKWHSRQLRDISMSVGAMEGSLGKDVSPNMRRFNSWMTVYQNIRLLPLSLFSSLVDPLALVARGAPMQAAYESFMYGMREVFRGWADAFKDMPPARARDEWRELSEHIGASEVAMFSHHVSEEYSSTYMTAGAKKLNDKMFVLNGMEAWNRGSRIMATKWAVRFLEKHASLPDPHHSKRWLSELGLLPGMLTLDEGKLVTNRDQLAALKGITAERADQLLAPVYDALNRWVEGAVLTPNAAQRPAWSSDPNYATMFHLKQFSYSFHQTILKRAVNEFKHGNMVPVGALAAFIPTMITADIMKGLLQGGGELPPYMASMNAGDWFLHGVNRAGLAGIGAIGVDASADMASLGGPAIEQAVDALMDPAGKSLLNAMPLHSLYGRAVM